MKRSLRSIESNRPRHPHFISLDHSLYNLLADPYREENLVSQLENCEVAANHKRNAGINQAKSKAQVTLANDYR